MRYKMSKFTTTFKSKTETNYILSPLNKFGIKYDKVNKIATVTVTVFDRNQPKGQKVQTFETVTFSTLADAKTYVWANEYADAKELVKGSTLIQSY
jgi:hypothetical protein